MALPLLEAPHDFYDGRTLTRRGIRMMYLQISLRPSLALIYTLTYPFEHAVGLASALNAVWTIGSFTCIGRGDEVQLKHFLIFLCCHFLKVARDHALQHLLDLNEHDA